jgi:hypothetical protein
MPLGKNRDGDAKSLSAKRYERFAEARVFPEVFSVLRSRRYRRIHVKNGARGRPFLFRFQAALLFSLENKIDVEFLNRFFIGPANALVQSDRNGDCS